MSAALFDALDHVGSSHLFTHLGASSQQTYDEKGLPTRFDMAVDDLSHVFGRHRNARAGRVENKVGKRHRER
jgi:hypothetical protein